MPTPSAISLSSLSPLRPESAAGERFREGRAVHFVNFRPKFRARLQGDASCPQGDGSGAQGDGFGAQGDGFGAQADCFPWTPSTVSTPPRAGCQSGAGSDGAACSSSPNPLACQISPAAAPTVAAPTSASAIQMTCSGSFRRPGGPNGMPRIPASPHLDLTPPSAQSPAQTRPLLRGRSQHLRRPPRP